MHFPCKLFGSFKKKQYLCSRFREKHATVAQLVEQRIRNAWVGGSSPPSGSKKERFLPLFFVLQVRIDVLPNGVELRLAVRTDGRHRHHGVLVRQHDGVLSPHAIGANRTRDMARPRLVAIA